MSTRELTAREREREVVGAVVSAVHRLASATADRMVSFPGKGPLDFEETTARELRYALEQLLREVRP